MSRLVMPEVNADTMSRRAEIVSALRAICPGEGVIDTASEMRAYESDGLTAYRQLPLVVGQRDGQEAAVAGELGFRRNFLSRRIADG